MNLEVSKSVLRRLPLYLAYMKTLNGEENIYISATSLANALHLGEVQVRKDLAVVSNSGRPKVGYLRTVLIQELEHFLGYDYTDQAILVGAGKLGQALLDYTGFAQCGLEVMVGFDLKPGSGYSAGGKPILPMDQLESYIRSHDIRIGIITTNEENAQSVCDLLVSCGIRAIWNFAPVRLEVPEKVILQNENLASSLAVISMRMQALWKENQ